MLMQWTTDYPQPSLELVKGRKFFRLTVCCCNEQNGLLHSCRAYKTTESSLFNYHDCDACLLPVSLSSPETAFPTHLLCSLAVLLTLCGRAEQSQRTLMLTGKTRRSTLYLQEIQLPVEGKDCQSPKWNCTKRAPCICPETYHRIVR